MMQHLRNVNEKSVREEVGRAIRNGKCILLVGFGSIQACASDKELLHGMFQWCVREGLIDQEETKKDFEKLFEKGSLDIAALKIQEYLTEKSQQQQCLKEVLGHIHRLIAQIPFRAYLSTSCGTCIEDAYSKEKAPASLTKYDKTSIEDAIKEHRKQKPFILKLHDDGDNDDLGSTILSDRTFKSISRHPFTYRSSLRMLLSDSHTLFIGFEKTDPHLEDFKGLISKKETTKGWVVVPERHVSPPEAKELWESKSISTLEYTTHPDLINFLEKIEELSSTPREIEIYISYADARKDKEMRKELGKYLETQNYPGLKINWCDGKIGIGAGEEREPEIERRLNTAEVMLLLVSVDYLSSLKKHSNIETEMAQAVERHDKGEARVIPVILRHCSWEDASFANLQTLPMSKPPISTFTGAKREEVYKEVAESIREAIEAWTEEH